MKTIVKDALRLAEAGIPVFPTNDKKPALSNHELSKVLGRPIGKGEGGYKVATCDPDDIEAMFSNPKAIELAVPMGRQSGYMAVDVDLYKMPELKDWVTENWQYLKGTLAHMTRSGGFHYIFKHPGDTVRFPATLREGVDIKAVGNGYVCWPPTEGYRVAYDNPILDFPMGLLRNAMLEKGGTGSTKLGSAFNEASDDDLIERIQDASDLYPALRSLSYRLPSRRQENGYRLTTPEMVNILENLMDTSVAAEAGHPRYDDWCDRRSKIPDLVETAVEKERGGVVLTDDDIELMTQGESFIETQKMIAKGTRPIGPQPQITTEEIEELITEMGTEDKSSDDATDSDVPERLNVKGLRERTIDPLKWLVENMIPIKSTCSLAGPSNVGKTRFLASLVIGLAVGDTARMGLPQCVGKTKTLWIANEEAVDDIARRCKAVALQHDDKDSVDWFVRGKDKGMMKLVVSNENGDPEVDKKAVARLVKWIRAEGIGLLILDPYNTLSIADENSASATGLTTDAMLTVISMTECAVLFAHHCPKDRSKDYDWMRGDPSAWRGSTQVYTSLDCGYTLSPWMPKNAEQRKAWKKAYLEEDLSKWVVLDVGKIREGEGFPPVVYHLEGQAMDEGEGRDIGVCVLKTALDAENALLHTNADIIAASSLGTDLIIALGYGRHTNMTKVAKEMEGHPLIPNIKSAKGKQEMYAMFQETVACEGGYVAMIDGGAGTTNKWAIQIDEKEKGNE